jgi:hypothetical protein
LRAKFLIEEPHQAEKLILFLSSFLIIEMLGGYTERMNEDTQTIRNIGLFVLGIGGLVFLLGIVAYLII